MCRGRESERTPSPAAGGLDKAGGLREEPAITAPPDQALDGMFHSMVETEARTSPAMCSCTFIAASEWRQAGAVSTRRFQPFVSVRVVQSGRKSGTEKYRSPVS